MAVSLQRAGMWKRISAFLFDAILLGILAVLFAFLFSSILGYDRYVDTLNRAYETYGEKYGVDFQTSLSQYDSMTEYGLAVCSCLRAPFWASTPWRS